MRRLDCNLRKAIRKHNVRQIEDCISIYKEKNYPFFVCKKQHYYTHLELLLIQMIIQCDIVLGEIEEARLLLEGMHDYSERLDMDWEKQEML